jgi:hypothetical protein
MLYSSGPKLNIQLILLTINQEKSYVYGYLGNYEEIIQLIIYIYY